LVAPNEQDASHHGTACDPQDAIGKTAGFLAISTNHPLNGRSTESDMFV